MNIVVVKLSCACGLFLWGVLGASSVQVVKGVYPGLLQLCNAIAGGVLLTVSTVHMLSENAEKLEEWGLAFTRTFKPSCQAGIEECEAFPLGNALFVVGMILIISLQQCFGHTHLDGHDSHDSGEESSDDSDDEGECKVVGVDEEELSSQKFGSQRKVVRGNSASSTGSTLAGVGTAVGISVHSFVESVAMGSTDRISDFTSLLFAVALHKGFTAFSVGSALKDSPKWWVGVFCYSIVAPSGIVCGVLLMQLPGAFAAAVQCLAAGTLMTIGLTDMLLPALNPEISDNGGLNLVAACFSATAMALLAVWL